jgi:hypothetical protein
VLLDGPCHSSQAFHLIFVPKAGNKRIGDRAIIRYRINSTSFWEGDLEIDDARIVHLDLEQQTDIDYVRYRPASIIRGYTRR